MRNFSRCIRFLFFFYKVCAKLYIRCLELYLCSKDENEYINLSMKIYMICSQFFTNCLYYVGVGYNKKSIVEIRGGESTFKYRYVSVVAFKIINFRIMHRLSDGFENRSFCGFYFVQ